MKRLLLQINTNRSGRSVWRNIGVFDAQRAPEVEDAAAMLSRAAGGLSLAIFDESSNSRRVLNERGVFAAEVVE